MNKKILVSILAVFGALGIVIGYWLISPLFMQNEVNETLESSGISVENITEFTSYRGIFVDGDDSHNGEGSLAVIENGMRVLRLEEDFKVTNGPDLYVWLVSSVDDPKSDYINLGRLKGNVGSQNYEIPDGVDLEKYDKVVIWCRAFSVLFASAELR